MYKPKFNIGDIVIEKKDNVYSSNSYSYRGNHNVGKSDVKNRLPYVGIVTSVEKETNRTEEGEEVYYLYQITGNEFVWYEHQLEIIKERGNTSISSHSLESSKEDALIRIDNVRTALKQAPIDNDTKLVVDLDIIFVKPVE